MGKCLFMWAMNNITMDDMDCLSDSFFNGFVRYITFEIERVIERKIDKTQEEHILINDMVRGYVSDFHIDFADYQLDNDYSVGTNILTEIHPILTYDKFEEIIKFVAEYLNYKLDTPNYLIEDSIINYISSEELHAFYTRPLHRLHPSYTPSR